MELGALYCLFLRLFTQPNGCRLNGSRRLIDLAGLPPCDEDLSGISLGPVVRNPPTTGTGIGQKYAFSQFPRE